MEQKNIRNFAIIAHVDHGKSTLADRFLEFTETVSKNKITAQFLDSNPISRERGITIKLAPVRMKYSLGGENYYLNLIDTPGHVDFSYEVSRTLAACEGAILLVDATQGIQAQTVAHFNTAQALNLKIIPVINKIDLPTAKKEEVAIEMEEIFGINRSEVIYVSAKTGENVELLLTKIVSEIPPPHGNEDSVLRALVFDAVYDEHRGVIAYVRIVDGKVNKGDKIRFSQSNTDVIASDLGFFAPALVSEDDLKTGEIGFIVTGIKDIRKTGVGDTIIPQGELASPLPGYKKPQPMIFFGLYPKNTADIIKLKDGLNKLALNDNSLTYTEEYSSFLGSGFKVGFLGLLHADIVRERLKLEQGVDLLLTMPQIVYETKEDGSLLEPYMNLTIYSPKEYVGNVMTVCQKNKGDLVDLVYYKNNAVLKYSMPYSSLIQGLSADLKSSSSGFASIDYEVSDYREADLKKIEVLINGVNVDVLSELAYREDSPYKAREKAKILKDSLPKQQFRQIIQATIDGNIIAREEISPFRKDVLAKMSGGDRTRKDKLLEAQKKGKKKMGEHSKISLPQDVLFSLVEKN